MPREKEAYSPNGNIDPDLGYGQPVEIRIAAVPLRQRKWDALYTDLMLRLEQTAPSRALAVSFLSWSQMKSAKAALYKRARKEYGAGHVTLIERKDPPTLFVHRGPNWTQYPHSEELED